MNKKIYLLSIVLLFTFNDGIHPSPQKELLKNLSLFYAGSWLGLKVVANIAAELSGATPVYGKDKLYRPFLHWEHTDPTESIIKKNLLWVANSSYEASRLAIKPLTWTAMLGAGVLFDFILLMTSGTYDIKRFITGKKIEEKPSLNKEQFIALKSFVYDFPDVFLSLIGGFGVPLILQALYQKLQK